jgi:hypothetical protein
MDVHLLQWQGIHLGLGIYLRLRALYVLVDRVEQWEKLDDIFDLPFYPKIERHLWMFPYCNGRGSISVSAWIL